MSNSKNLKKYLIDDEYLFDPKNNGNVIMLSGVWGSGKTHFWKNRIEPELEKLSDDNKAYVYVSLYGKENTESIKNEILLKAYESVKKENGTLTRTASVFNTTIKYVPSISLFGAKIDLNSINHFFTSKKVNEAKEYLLDGGLICVDDFERKSENISLNDLFGLFTQLSQDMKCKMVLILNSDVFEGKEAVIFRNVKEKTVNKFLHFSPSIDELYQSVFDEDKYKTLLPFQDNINEWIKHTEELNARLYIQVLDNCLEWVSKDFSVDALKALTYISIFFSKHHFTLEYRAETNTNIYTVVDYFLHKGFYEIASFLTRTAPQLFLRENPLELSETTQILMSHINKHKKDDKTEHSEDYLQRENEEIEKHRSLIVDFVKYVYILKVDVGIELDTYLRVNNFVKNGILLKDN
ncbi:hypothetical protein Sulku_1693 [Sulfuricurvum kujiense DSM 16994]|uniref:KAP NTPase domain-containing protein n=1 Tax=Sulfuricurvum kujiense (strain ATCC BAA-921 / DSM 16994 / JCM 11577 / YK-1) TaxID=709032 RepID=E4U0N7_SULKY|nr:P-loop NTPase fold protein [Sulfuricurvum kujiense]ADR34354.1 hypothetical protein Sulku_1693 [Sulfuricurvum kujiense DSM 16994]